MRRIALLAASILLALPALPASADQTFIIPRDEGYGIGECFATGAPCARTVADAWCAAMGRGPSVSFGLQTQGVERISTRNKGGYVVTCS